jgi:hypothetical protein
MIIAPSKTFLPYITTMKTLQITSVLALAYAGLTAAYPSILAELEAKKQAPSLKKRLGGIFDAASQKVDVSGAHAFTPPGPGDQRGPCPGLNALSNVQLSLSIYENHADSILAQLPSSQWCWNH